MWLGQGTVDPSSTCREMYVHMYTYMYMHIGHIVMSIYGSFLCV